MSADLFDFHRGGDGVERMTDGEKRKLTLLNPMRNVGFAVRIFFFIWCHIIQWCLFSSPPSLAQTIVMEISQGLNSAQRVVTPPAQKMRCCHGGGGGDQRQWWMMTMWEQFSYLDEILSGALYNLSSAGKTVKKKPSRWGANMDRTGGNVEPARSSTNERRKTDVKIEFRRWKMMFGAILFSCLISCKDVMKTAESPLKEARVTTATWWLFVKNIFNFQKSQDVSENFANLNTG